MVVSLDPRERFCGCGGVGHLEGIMGQRAMRLRFLDLEPDEVFENAQPRRSALCRIRQALASRAGGRHSQFDSPGRTRQVLHITGFNSKHLDLNLLDHYLHEMVKMSPLQSYVFEVVAGTDEIGVIGAAVSGLHAAFQVAGV